MFACIVLAAGEGSRLGRCKANLPFGFNGQTFLSHIINIYLNSHVDKIYVVTGNWECETVAAAQKYSSMVSFVNNDNPKMGMFSSVCKGVSLLDKNIEYFFVHPVDIPLVKEETLHKMKNTVLNSGNNKTWVVPEYKNEEGHPVLIPSLLVPELLNWNGERGLQGFLSQQKDNKIIEYVNDVGTIFDIDCEDNYLKLTDIIKNSPQNA